MQLRTMMALVVLAAVCSAAPYVHDLSSPLLRHPAFYQETLVPVYQPSSDYFEDSAPLFHEVWRRQRRSLQPGAPQVSLPGSQPQDGGVDVSVTRERDVGTVVDAQGRTNVWRSDDGNTRVDAHGHWQRVYDGPAHGQRSHGAGITFSHRWR